MTRENTVNVSVEPTEAMLSASTESLIEQYDANGDWDDAKDVIEKLDTGAIYRAMLSAAPLHEGEGEDAFDAWLYGQEGYGLRAERLSEELRDPLDRVLPWLRAAFDVGRSAPGSSSLKGADTHRVAETTVVGDLSPGFGTLHPATADLADRFARAMKEKLEKAEAKYGYSDGWLSDDWQEDLVRDLAHHVQKGDPRDVAAYCAFAWHHGWSTTPNPSVEVERLREALEGLLPLAEDAYHRGQLRDPYNAPAMEKYGDGWGRILLARAALSRKQEPGVPTPGDWIEWSGGENPVPGDRVDYKTSNGHVGLDWFSGNLRWDADDLNQIIAYRIVPTPGGEGE